MILYQMGGGGKTPKKQWKADQLHFERRSLFQLHLNKAQIAFSVWLGISEWTPMTYGRIIE